MLKLNTEVLGQLGYKHNPINNLFTKEFERYGIYIHISYRFISSGNYSFYEKPSLFIRGNCYIHNLESIEILKNAYLRGMEDIAKATIEDIVAVNNSEK